MIAPTPHRALILLGSNIQRERNIPLALEELAHSLAGQVLAVSALYESAAVGGSAAQPAFSNCAALLETTQRPAALRQTLRGIEAKMGRRRGADKFAPRPIDLDIVLYDDFVGNVEGSEIPDPDLLRYAHVAIPCSEIAPEWIHPIQGQSLREISRGVDRSGLHLLPRLLCPDSDPQPFA